MLGTLDPGFTFCDDETRKPISMFIHIVQAAADNLPIARDPCETGGGAKKTCFSVKKPFFKNL